MTWPVLKQKQLLKTAKHAGSFQFSEVTQVLNLARNYYHLGSKYSKYI